LPSSTPASHEGRRKPWPSSGQETQISAFKPPPCEWQRTKMAATKRLVRRI
jgi:hypothetical protein